MFGLQYRPRYVRRITKEEGILGILLGGLMIAVDIYKWSIHEYLVHGAIQETLVVAIALMMLVSGGEFVLPTLFNNRPRLAAFALPLQCGFISLLFDSFAVVLLLNSLTIGAFIYRTDFTDSFSNTGRNQIRTVREMRFSPAFSQSVFKIICAFNALTVGGAFYLGELWGLPYYLSSGFGNPTAGLPLLLVLAPYCFFTSALAAWKFPVSIEPVPMDKAQIRAMIEFVAFLALLIVTHRPVMVIGALLVYYLIIGRMTHLIEKTIHELHEGGGLLPLGLILGALLLQEWHPANKFIIDLFGQGNWIVLFSALSSPMAGAMVPPAGDIGEFYTNLSRIMIGAPFFVWSSLVAIMVFNNEIRHDDLPKSMQWLPGAKSRGKLEEWAVYTLVVLPLNAGLAFWMWVGNESGLFVWAYNLMH